jgi:four helix bundle protein
MQNKNSNTNLKKRVYIFALDIIEFIEALNKKQISTQVIAKQLLRSATSVGANVIEAQAGRSRRDFTNFLVHALKSANETKFWLCLLRDSHKADRQQTNKLLQETKEIANILGASILTLKGKTKI